MLGRPVIVLPTEPHDGPVLLVVETAGVNKPLRGSVSRHGPCQFNASKPQACNSAALGMSAGVIVGRTLAAAGVEVGGWSW